MFRAEEKDIRAGKTKTRERTHTHVFLWCAIIQAAITRSCRIHPFSDEFFPLPFPQLILSFILSPPSSLSISSPFPRSLFRRLTGDQPFFFANCHAVTVVISSYPPPLLPRLSTRFKRPEPRVCAHVIVYAQSLMLS